MDFAVENLRARSSRDAYARKALIAIDAAVDEVRREHGKEGDFGEASPSALFAVLLSGLETKEGARMAKEIFYALDVVCRFVPRGVLARFSEATIAAGIAGLQARWVNDDKRAFGRVLGCCGWFLRGVAAREWETPAVQQVLSALLEQSVADNGHVRRCAQQALVHACESDAAVAGKRVLGHLKNQLDHARPKRAYGAVRFLSFLAAFGPRLPPRPLAQLCAVLVDAPRCGDAVVGLLSTRVLTAIMDAPVANVTRQLAYSVTGALLDRAPAPEDAGRVVEYSYSLAAAYVRLVSLQAPEPATPHHAASGLLAREQASVRPHAKPAHVDVSFPIESSVAKRGCEVVRLMFDLLQTRHPTASAAVCNAAASVLETLGQGGITEEDARDIGNTIARRIKLNSSIGTALGSLSALFLQRCSRFGAHAVAPVVDALLRLHSSAEAEEDMNSKRVVERALAAALRHLGPSTFLDLVPLTTTSSTSSTPSSTSSSAAASSSASATGSTVAGEETLLVRNWVVQLLQRHVKFARQVRIATFAGPVLRAAMQCEVAAQRADKKGRPKLAKRLRADSVMLWRLFPSFCACPTDVAESFGAKLGAQLEAQVRKPAYEPLPRIIASGIGTLIVRLRLSCGLPPLETPEDDGGGDDDDDEEGAGEGGGDRAGAMSVRSRLSQMSESAPTFLGGVSGFDLEGGSVAGSVFAFGKPKKGKDRAGIGRVGPEVDGDDEEEGGGGGEWEAGSEGGGEEDGLFGGGGVGSGSVVPPVRQHPALAIANGWGLRVPFLDQPTAEKALEHVSRLSGAYLSVFFPAYEAAARTHPKLAPRLLECVAALVAIAPEEVPHKLFDQLERILVQMGTLVEEKGGKGGDDEADRALGRVGNLLSLALAVIPRLNSDELSRLWGLLEPMFGNHKFRRQEKKAYKALVLLITLHPGFVARHEKHRDAMMSTLVGSLGSTSAGAKRARIGALTHLVLVMDPRNGDHLESMSALLREAVTLTRDPSDKVRDTSFELLVAIVRQMAEVYGIGSPAALHCGAEDDPAVTYLNSIVRSDDDSLIPMASRGLEILQDLSNASKSPDEDVTVMGIFATLLQPIRSKTSDADGSVGHGECRSSILSLARLLYEFREEEAVQAIVPSLLHAVLQVLHTQSGEVVRAVLGFVKVIISVFPPRELQVHVPAIVDAIMTWPGEARRGPRSRIRVVLDRLCRRFGVEAVGPFLPEKDLPLLRHLRRAAARRERKRREARVGDGGGEDGEGESGDGGRRSRRRKHREEAAKAARESFGMLLDEDEDDDASFGGDHRSYRSGVSGISLLDDEGDVDDMDEEELGLDIGTDALTVVTGTPLPLGAGAGSVRGSHLGHGKGRRRRDAADESTWLRADDEQPLDLLDPGLAKAMVTADPATMIGRKRGRALPVSAIAYDSDDDDDENGGGRRGGPRDEEEAEALRDAVTVSKSGKIRVRDKEAEALAKRAHQRRVAIAGFSESAKDEDEKTTMWTRRSKDKKGGRKGDGKGRGGKSESRADVSAAGKSTRGGGSRKGERRGGREKHVPSDIPFEWSGAAYRSKSGAGDAKRKGQKLEPFAYYPIDPKQLSGKGGKRAVQRYEPLVDGATPPPTKRKKRK